ncbi:MAG: aminoacyl-tRNA hydrolase, partial [Endomicrobium sp.]|nr:aminoacyl-tRNA hydrolase [Endomicrobium sp.]
NPGQEYKNTRHNFGFKALDLIAESKGISFKNWENAADISFYEAPDGKVFLIKPMTFMNLSGGPVCAFAKYYKIKPEEIFVFYDDFSIPLGEFKIKMSGSSAGHNGISSLIKHLGTDAFARMKLGIGPLPKFIKMPDFVLSKFSEQDNDKVKTICEKAVSFFEEACKSGIEKAISKTENRRLSPAD